MSSEQVTWEYDLNYFLNGRRFDLNLIYASECASASDHEQVSFLAEDRLSNVSVPSTVLIMTLLTVPATLDRAVSLFATADDQALLDEEQELELIDIRSLLKNTWYWDYFQRRE